jgi:hypothetical protein
MRRRCEEDEKYGDCPEHGRVRAKWENHGIGHYEAWGHKAYDCRMVSVCPECDETLENVE